MCSKEDTICFFFLLEALLVSMLKVFLLNLLGCHWVIRLYMFQVCISMLYSLYIVLLFPPLKDKSPSVVPSIVQPVEQSVVDF